MSNTSVKNKLVRVLTRSEVLAAILPIGAILVASILTGGAMFSPGDLNKTRSNFPKGGVRSHADLAQECDACHVPFWREESMEDRCVACHTEITQELKIESSMHAFFETLHTCLACHQEHQGATAPLIYFDLVVFPHQNVGYFLTAHRELPASNQPECRSCHPESVRKFDVDECRKCHTQVDAAGTQKHIDLFHSECLRCHDGVDRFGADFDHQQTRFPLEKAHVDVDCEVCHPVASSIVDLQAASRQCLDCHEDMDVHAGQLSILCDRCHVPVNWQTVSVDHELTEYPLIGAHTSVECQSCHVDKQWVGLDSTCYACHVAVDEHDGQNGSRCEICHHETAWSEQTFDHADTAMPLIGGHAGIACESCHLEAEFKALSPICVDCHADPDFHAGFFESECSECHTVDAWFPTLTLYRTHDAFPLIHGGGTTTCKTCHPNTLDDYTCYGCHEHTPASVESQHTRVAKYFASGTNEVDFNPCYKCHKTGNPCRFYRHCE